jgi:hypothetical protein
MNYGHQLSIDEAVCPVCDSVFTGDPNEEGIPEIPDQQKCAAPDCQIFLCPKLCREHLSFVCDGCGQRFCYLHAVYTDGGERFCRDCFLGLPDQETGRTRKEMEAA